LRAEQLGLGLTAQEMATVRRSLGREPNETEWSVIDAEWSEHSSYKSSRGLLKLFPTSGKRVVLGPGYDAGVVDVGDGYVVTLHIESHNHPSAVDPYGGASTGIGGVLRDILSVASRPIALIDILRFGLIDKSGHSRWLFKNVVRGIADYGNCISGEDLVYFTNSSTFHVEKAKDLFDDFTSKSKLTPEFNRDDLKIGRPNVDLRVLSFDFEKNEARFCRVSRMYQANADRLLRIRTALGRNVSVTPDHPMFVLEDGAVTTKQARDVRVGDSVPLVCDFPFSEAGVPTPSTIDLILELGSRGIVDGITVTFNRARLKSLRKKLDPLLKKAGVNASQRSHFFNANYMPLKVYLGVESMAGFPLERRELLLHPRRGRATKIPAVIDVDSDFSRLVGYYLSEGCNHEEKGDGRGGKTSRVVWTFRKDESEYIQDLCNVLQSSGIRHTKKRQTKTNAVQIGVSSRILGLLFEDVMKSGRNPCTKRIPDLFYRLSPELSVEVLKGMLRGDASVRTTLESPSIDIRFATCSPTLFQQVLLLVQSLGYTPSTRSSSHEKSTVPSYELTISGRTQVESLKDMFSMEIASRAEKGINLYSQPAMGHYRSKRYGKFAAVKVTEIEEIAGNFGVYNFEVEGTHNYVTSGGIVTHNCVGVPTVAGEIEFDDSFERNCLVDVACVGLGKKDDLILGEAKAPGDVLVLIGGSTGRDGIKGATFASKNLREDAASERSSVQVPDPFMKKLLLDALLEIVAKHGKIHGMKDLGGGGLSTALSEVASKGGTGVDVELKRVRLREDDMSPTEVMISESQERMLLVLPPGDGGEGVVSVLDKYGVPHSVIGKVTASPRLTLRWDGDVVADLPASLVTDAPLIDWPYRRPRKARALLAPTPPRAAPGFKEALLSLLSSPNIASKRWVYQQYDHEVGVRTVIKPGQADAAAMRLPNGRFLAIKGDGNSRQASLDPYEGAAGCVAEACRNVVAVGAEPIALVDHLQSGDPSDPEVYWAFRETLRGMADYCKAVGLPVVGGKVSFYNEDSATGRAIKPSPIALVVGLVSKESDLRTMAFKRNGDRVLVVGETRPELGGSELSARFPGSVEKGGSTPRVDASQDLRTNHAILRLIEEGLVNAVHDCSGGGLAVAAAEMAIAGGIGARMDLSMAPNSCRTASERAFSESHGRFVVTGRDADAISASLRRARVKHRVVGEVGGTSFSIAEGRSPLARISVSSLRSKWEGAIPELMD
jgi:phosphoribosylformylglycinamidine synthase subunit PurL